MKQRVRIFFRLMLIVSGGLLPGIGNAQAGNPVIPGDFADPFILTYRDTFYIYATSGSEATVWRSPNLVDWKLTKLNWPTSMHKPDIWAPTVARGHDGRFYLYTSTDHNIYAGVADHPMGPFRNILGTDSIFIKNRQYWPTIHSIDADCFVDEDGQAYLYWGSGFDFKDGICAVGRLNPDMASFGEQPVLITPSGYFEGPHMMKRKGSYYLMYSDGLYYDSSYKVRYARSSSPLGPFVEAPGSPILRSDPASGISGPGHHSMLHTKDDRWFIVYHRHIQPLYPAGGGPWRQVCIDEVFFDEAGNIKPVVATKVGIINQGHPGEKLLKPVSVVSSSQLSKDYAPGNAFDGDKGSLWLAKDDHVPATITADYGMVIRITSIAPFFARVMGDYHYSIDVSEDGKRWMTYATRDNAPAQEWPAISRIAVKARYIRLTMLAAGGSDSPAGLWELQVSTKKK